MENRQVDVNFSRLYGIVGNANHLSSSFSVCAMIISVLETNYDQNVGFLAFIP